MPRTGVPFIRTLVWSAVLLAAVRRTLDTKATDYEEHIKIPEIQVSALHRTYLLGRHFHDRRRRRHNAAFCDDFRRCGTRGSFAGESRPSREADIVEECAEYSRDSAYEGWRKHSSRDGDGETVMGQTEWPRVVSALEKAKSECLHCPCRMAGRRRRLRSSSGGVRLYPWELMGFGLEEKSARF